MFKCWGGVQCRLGVKGMLCLWPFFSVTSYLSSYNPELSTSPTTDSLLYRRGGPVAFSLVQVGWNGKGGGGTSLLDQFNNLDMKLLVGLLHKTSLVMTVFTTLYMQENCVPPKSGYTLWCIKSTFLTRETQVYKLLKHSNTFLNTIVNPKL